MIRVTMKALDNKVITPRTGKQEVKGSVRKIPENGDYLMVIFDEEERTESPGVFTEINNLELIDKEYRYIDNDGRLFSLTIME